MKLPVNEHPAERVLRTGIGLALLSQALFRGKAWGWIGIVPLITGTSGRCPAYYAANVTTTPKPHVTKANPVGEAYVAGLRALGKTGVQITDEVRHRLPQT